MRVVVDVCLAPSWVQALRSRGIDAVHWSDVGEVWAKDSEIMAWARAQNRIVLTSDLDFGALLALTRGRGPSVVQLRTQDLLPTHLEATVARVLDEHGTALAAGAIITIDELSERLRVLPIGKNPSE